MCRCECGVEVEVIMTRLTTGNTKSCGCGKLAGLLQHVAEQKEVGFIVHHVRWATPKEQARNTRRTVYAEFKGERLPVVEIAERLGIPSARLYYRIRRAMTDIERRIWRK